MIHDALFDFDEKTLSARSETRAPLSTTKCAEKRIAFTVVILSFTRQILLRAHRFLIFTCSTQERDIELQLLPGLIMDLELFSPFTDRQNFDSSNGFEK